MPTSDIPLHELFHENTKNRDTPVDPGSKAPDSWSEISYQAYPGADRTMISSPPADTKQIFNTISNRRSPNMFTGENISTHNLGALLSFGAGITDWGGDPDTHRRAYPSAGAMYPLELYLCPLAISGLDPGVYHFNVREECLEQLTTEVYREDMSFIANDLTETAAVALFLTSAFDRTTKKYSDRGYRYVLMEAGHLMQNVCLVAEALELGCRPIAGFNEDKADEFLDCPHSETTLYIGLVGVPRER